MLPVHGREHLPGTTEHASTEHSYTYDTRIHACSQYLAYYYVPLYAHNTTENRNVSIVGYHTLPQGTNLNDGVTTSAACEQEVDALHYGSSTNPHNSRAAIAVSRCFEHSVADAVPGYLSRFER